MKKIWSFILVTALVVVSACSDSVDWNLSKDTAKIQNENQRRAETVYPVPQTNNFMERKTVSEWVKRWDKPNIPCYTYIFIGGSAIGYFVTNGKPASTQSYLIPEDMDIYYTSGSSGHAFRQSPDLDGTYGSNNPGYRFFLATGTAVECSGAMVSCIYSDSPLNLQCPLIKAIQQK